ncbi:HalOD1 output domain-containing protein [Haloarchaeobius sp. TZWSO28]|uniref:HalOD1 output domain-containing protein n=1 Tax=Haloarchaeobius sp. TZWSO28 TaxID=3446119 RepID=UPI003EBC85A7
MRATHVGSTPDTRNESILIDIVRTVAAVRDVRPTELPPLADIVNPDALETMFLPPGKETPNPNGYVSFTYADCAVVVYGDRSIAVELLRPDHGDRR